jgi:ribosomal protein S26
VWQSYYDKFTEAVKKSDVLSSFFDGCFPFTYSIRFDCGVVCALIILILRVRRRNSRGNRKRDLTKQKDEGESHQPYRGGVHSGDEIGSD